MIERRNFFLFFLVACMVLALPAWTVYAVPAIQQDDFAEDHAREFIAGMTPEERVGQLFLVTFTGTSAGTDTEIYDLIINHHIGGVLLQSASDNFLEGPGSLSFTYDLIAELQSVEWKSSQGPTVDPGTGGPASISYIPLLVGISGGWGSSDQLPTGLTSLPDEMAIGATWDISLAEDVGRVAGQELSQLGFNLYLGPSLDVLEAPDATLENGLGARVFGGDPFWVGQMGQAYIRGLHGGSENGLLVIARNFPGRGSTDRPAGEEPATVRKTLEALKQIELAPFFSVTGEAPDESSKADGLLVSHIRYQGFQGNIRSTTRPVSFDAQALSQILALPALSQWRSSGGLLVSEDLGSSTVQRFFDPTGTNFQARQVARDAFLAGNDLINLGNIISSDEDSNYSTVLNILTYFVQKYREDPAFAQLVDDAVLRILAAKFSLYPDFDLNRVVPQQVNLNLLGNADAITFQVARKAATLVNPDLGDLSDVLPEPPGLADDIVFITDTRSISQCVDCSQTALIGLNDMQNAVLRLYGPDAGGLVNASRLSSYSLESLATLLDDGAGDPVLERSIYQSDWLVINMLDAAPGQVHTQVMRRFLGERQDLLRNKNIVVFAFEAPFYLDSTDISKLTAYYCLYSSSAPFINAAVRLLFQEMTPGDALPVSVSGIGYDLFTALSPDPEQVITLQVESPPTPEATAATDVQATPTVSFSVGDSVTVLTGVIVDHNGNPVPDGTNVQFTLTQSGVSGVMQQVDAVTAQGVARATFNIDRSGLLEIRAASEPAKTSVILQMDVSGESFSVTVVAPTPEANPQPTPEKFVTPVPAETNEPATLPNLGSWFFMIVMLTILAGGSFLAGKRGVSFRWGLRWGLCTAVGVVTAYLYLAGRLPGSVKFMEDNGYLGMSLVVLSGGILGLAAGVLWSRLKHRL